MARIAIAFGPLDMPQMREDYVARPGWENQTDRRAQTNENGNNQQSASHPRGLAHDECWYQPAAATL
jgi:hypothetical protein